MHHAFADAFSFLGEIADDPGKAPSAADLVRLHSSYRLERWLER